MSDAFLLYQHFTFAFHLSDEYPIEGEEVQGQGKTVLLGFIHHTIPLPQLTQFFCNLEKGQEILQKVQIQR